MSTLPMPGVADTGGTERLARIWAQMAVEDASGERIGRVTDVRIGAAAAIGGASRPAAGAPQAPDLPAELTERLLRVGYIKIEDTRYFRRDFRYYATIDQVAAVDASVVRLDGHCCDLIAVFD